MSEKKRDPISKSFAVLDWFVSQARNDISLKEIAAGAGFPLSTAHRIVSALCDTGFVSQDASGRYQLGLELVRIARIAVASAPLPKVGVPHLRELVRKFDETGILFQYDSLRQQMIMAAVFESTKPLRYVFSLYEWLPIHAGASGIAILSFLNEDEKNSVLDRYGLSKLTSRTITDKKELESQIEKTRKRGYAISAGHRVPGAIGISAPIFSQGKMVVGGVSITIPESRFDKKDEPALAEGVLECARMISRDLGQ